MKKLLPIFLLLPALVFASDLNKKEVKSNAKKSLKSDNLAINPVDANDICEDVTIESTMQNAEGSVALGSSGNLYSILRSTSNMVAANQDINSVVFIHRSNSAVGNPTPNTTSQYRYDVSTDGGNTFTNDVGPLNFHADNTSGDNAHARYPQVSIYNPPGNTDPNVAYLTYMGATHNGAGGADTWDGIVNGVARLDGSVFNMTENNLVPYDGDVLIPNSLVEGLPGEFWAADWIYDGVDSYEMLLYHGTFDGSNINYTTSLLDVYPDRTFDGTAYTFNGGLAFSDDGMTGYITLIGDAGIEGCGDQTLEPIYYYTTDGGATWDGPRTIELADFDGFVDDLIETITFEDGTTETTVPTLSLTYDAVVDANGVLHIGCGIFSTGLTGGAIDPYTFYPTSGIVCDLIIDGSTDSRELKGLSGLLAYESTAIVADFTNNFRIQVSKNAASDKIFFTYLDSIDAELDNPDIAYRDLYGIGYDVNTGMATAVKNFTGTNTQWQGLAYYASSAPEALTNGSTHAVPTVFTEIPGTDLETVYYHYFQDATFDDSEFTETVETSNYGYNVPTTDGLSMNQNALTVDFTFDNAADFCGVYWDFGDGTTEITTDASASHTYANVDATYTVVAKLANQAGQVIETATVTISTIVDTEGPVITLNGGEDVTITYEIGETWESLGSSVNGYSATDAVDGPVDVTVTGTVDVEVIGTYTLTYTSTDLAGNETVVTQTITVIDDVAPQMLNNSPTTQTVACGEDLPTINIIANDEYDGQLDVTSTGNVDVNVTGSYDVVYSAVDNSGNEAINPVTITFEVNCDPEAINYINNGFISVLPNPTNGELNINIQNINTINALVEVYNLQGKLMQQVKVSDSLLSIDLSAYNAGVYFVKVQTEEATIIEKVVLNK